MIEVSQLVAVQPALAGVQASTAVGAETSGKEAAGSWVGLFAMELLALLSSPPEPVGEPPVDEEEQPVQTEEQGDCDDPGLAATSVDRALPLRETNRDTPLWRPIEVAAETPREAALPDRGDATESGAPVESALVASDKTHATAEEDVRLTQPSVPLQGVHSGAAHAPSGEANPLEAASHDEELVPEVAARPQVFHRPPVENLEAGAEATRPEVRSPRPGTPGREPDRVLPETVDEPSSELVRRSSPHSARRALDLPAPAELDSIRLDVVANVESEVKDQKFIKTSDLHVVTRTVHEGRLDVVALPRPSREPSRFDAPEARAVATVLESRRPFSPTPEMPEVWRQSLRAAEPIPHVPDETVRLISGSPSTSFPQVHREARAVPARRSEPVPSASRAPSKGQAVDEQPSQAPEAEADRPAMRSELRPPPSPDRAPAHSRGFPDLDRESDDADAVLERLPLAESDRTEAAPRQRPKGEQPAAAKAPERQTEARGLERPAPLSPEAGTIQSGAEQPALTEPHASRAPLQQPGATTTTGMTPGSLPFNGELFGRQPAASAPPVPVERTVQVAAAQVSRAGEATRLTVVVEDDRLGSVALRLAERHGGVDVVLRAENPATARQFQSSLPQLYENLLQRGLQPDLRAWTPNTGADPERREGDRRQQRERDGRPQGRDRSGRGRPAFAIPSA